jgi:predicted nucleic acid-binding protein
MIEKIFLDTNILIYAYTSNEAAKTAFIHDFFKKRLPDTGVIISTQVLGEFYTVMARHKYPHKKIMEILRDLMNSSSVSGITLSTIEQCITLKEKYMYSWWDSLILASALESSCNIVFSEDMQHGQIIEKSLYIENPFLIKRVSKARKTRP